MKEMIIGRQHRIHFSTGEGKILCKIVKWECSDTDWSNVECKYCLRLKDKYSEQGDKHG